MSLQENLPLCGGHKPDAGFAGMKKSSGMETGYDEG